MIPEEFHLAEFDFARRFVAIQPLKLLHIGFRAAIAGNASEKGIFIPKSAITNRGGLDGCFVIRDGHAEFHWLRLGTTLPDGSREADAGLKGDEILVKSPPSSLTDGAPVKAIPDPAAAAGAAP